jgi:hypothetical protein
MFNRFELILIRWDDGLYKSRDRFEVTSIENLKEKFNELITDIQDRMSKEEKEKEERYRRYAEDDDIPF